MDKRTMQVCTICEDERFPDQVWFLVAENHWEDKLRILQWNDNLAARGGVHVACCAAHVQELVLHWMTTGSLDHPFAAAEEPSGVRRLPVGSHLSRLDIEISGARQIGELAVHRESIGRALSENPDSLQVILDELFEIVEREALGSSTEMESDKVTIPESRHI